MLVEVSNPNGARWSYDSNLHTVMEMGITTKNISGVIEALQVALEKAKRLADVQAGGASQEFQSLGLIPPEAELISETILPGYHERIARHPNGKLVMERQQILHLKRNWDGYQENDNRKSASD